LGERVKVQGFGIRSSQKAGGGTINKAGSSTINTPRAYYAAKVEDVIRPRALTVSDEEREAVGHERHALREWST